MIRYLVPALGIGVVVTLAAVLIGLVVLRAVPGMGIIFSPDTHSNLWEEAKPGYDRTKLAAVSTTSGKGYHVGAAEEPVGMSQVELGAWLFAGVGCAKCHGLEGAGGVFAPPITGANAQLVQAMARFGPGGMPAFPESSISAEGLAAIAAYLQGLTPVEQAAPAPTVTETPAGEGTEGTTQEPTLAETGAQMFSQAGCGACHGAQGQGSSFAPRIAGAQAEMVREKVRTGPGGMPAFSPDVLTDEELAAIIAYLESL